VADQHRLGAQLYAALSTLDEIHRAVLVLREVDGLEYKDMALILDVPEGTVMSRLWNARQKARTQLRDYRTASLAG
jgi:RNA polymerase sigma-70 factor (ECF subfamily)